MGGDYFDYCFSANAVFLLKSDSDPRLQRGIHEKGVCNTKKIKKLNLNYPLD